MSAGYDTRNGERDGTQVVSIMFHFYQFLDVDTLVSKLSQVGMR